MTETPLVLDPATTALVMVDMQNDFCTKGGFYDRSGQDIAALHAAVAPNILLLDRARRAGMPVVFTRIIRNEVEGPAEVRHALTPRRWFSYGARLVAGSWGAELVDGLQPRPGEMVIDKHGYSAFHRSGLEAHLRERKVRTLVLTGVVTYACVLATSFSAFDLGFDVVVAADATGSWIAHLGPATHDIVDLLLGAAVPASEVRFGPEDGG